MTSSLFSSTLLSQLEKNVWPMFVWKLSQQGMPCAVIIIFSLSLNLCSFPLQRGSLNYSFGVKYNLCTFYKLKKIKGNVNLPTSHKKNVQYQCFCVSFSHVQTVQVVVDVVALTSMKFSLCTRRWCSTFEGTEFWPEACRLTDL